MCCEMVVSLVFMSHFHLIFTLPIIINHSQREEEMANNSLHLDMIQNKSTIKRRVKRAGKDKFSQAATMTETKMFQMYLQLFKNLFASSYIGGAHPLHPDVPKPVILLFKQKIISFFFPAVGDDAKKVS